MKQSRKIQNVAISFHLCFLSSANQIVLVGCPVGLIYSLHSHVSRGLLTVLVAS